VYAGEISGSPPFSKSDCTGRVPRFQSLLCQLKEPLAVFEKLIRRCWAKVELGYSRILVRDCADAGWINYMLKDRQKSEFDGFVDCIIVESLHNPLLTRSRPLE
jgi:hypothetical protein